MSEEVKNPAAVALGSINSERKVSQARANLAIAHGRRELLPCTCSGPPHVRSCPVGRREQVARSRANRLKASGETISENS